MALEEQELREEQLAQLRRLAQSPAWGLYKTRLLRLVECKQREKARFLREGNLQQAASEQWYVDGVQKAVEELDIYMKELSHQEESFPAYA